MATVTAFLPVDLTNTTINRYALNLVDEGFVEDAFVQLGTTTYDDYYWVRGIAGPAGSEDRVFVMFGSGFEFDAITGAVKGGTVTAWLEAEYNGDDIYWVQDVSLPLSEMIDILLIGNSGQTQAALMSQFIGDDEFWLSDGDDAASGGAGNDTFHGGLGGDTLDGGDGNDVFYGGLGADSLIGGNGDDVFYINGPATLNPYDTALYDMISGGAGYDVVYAESALQVWTLDDVEEVFGSQFADIMRGDYGSPVYFHGGRGNDTIKGEGTLEGGDGQDYLTAINPSTLDGGSGADQMYGSSGDDIFIIDGFDFVDGDRGYDTAIIASQTGETIQQTAVEVERIVGGDGDDFIGAGLSTRRVEAGAGDDTIYAGWTDGEIFGEGGSDKIMGGDQGELLVGDGTPDDFFNDPAYAFLFV